MSHTPGPWGNLGPIIHSVGQHVAVVSCDKPNPDGMRGSKEQRANAKLIAAAPDLLAALKKVRADMSAECVVEGCTCGDGWKHDDPALIAEIDAAIAKATGSEAAHGN